MRLYRVSALIISLVAQVTVMCVSSQPTFIYIRFEPTGVDYRYVYFHDDTFQRLYNCMRAVNTTQCNVKINLENYKVKEVIFIHGSYTHRGYFTCQINQKTSSVECTRSTTSQCAGGNCISFRSRSSPPTCDTDCVYLLWTYAEEKLVFDNTTDQYDDCKLICAQTTNALIQSSHPSVASTLRPEAKSDATDVIIGVVCGVLCLVILVIAVGVIYRRHKQTKRHSGNSRANSSSTDIKHNESAAHRNEKSNVSNIPDVLSTLPYSGHAIEKNEESEDGYYTIDNDRELNRYQTALNTVSSKTSTINDNLNAKNFHRFQNELSLTPPIFHIQGEDDVNSELSHNREGDYFTIETEIDDVKDRDSENEHNDMGCGYSLGKDMSTIDAIDVSSQPKNMYSRFGKAATDRMNPYDVLLQPQGIQNSRKTSIGAAPLKGAVIENDAEVTKIALESAIRDRDIEIVSPYYVAGKFTNQP